MRTLRLSRSVTAKLTDVEHTRLSEVAAVAKQSISEFVRDCIMRVTQDSSSFSEHEVLLGELLALRAILINLTARSSTGKPANHQETLDIISQADQSKRLKARQRFNNAPQLSDGGRDEHTK